METFVHIIKLVGGGAMLFAGAEWLVRGAIALALRMGVTPLVIGLTIVAYGTSAPELAVSVSATLKEADPLVLGNVMGSCIANLGLVLGLTAIFHPPRVSSGILRREGIVLLIAVIAVPLTMASGAITLIEGLLLTAGSFFFTVFTLFFPGKDDSGTDEVPEEPELSIGRSVLIFGTGLALLLAGGELFVSGAREIALLLGASEVFVGLSVVALGTSAPELITSIIAARKGHSSLAIGNAIGSNIFNIFLALGVAGILDPVIGNVWDYKLDLSFLVGITLLTLFYMRSDRKITKVEGVILLTCYIAYIALAATRF